MPFFLAVPFTAVVTGLFNLSEFMSVPLGIAAGAVWGVVLGLIAAWLGRRPRARAWLADAFLFLGATAAAFAACGGLMALLLLKGALTSSSLTGSTLEQTFLPSIPYYIVVNSVLELLIVPGLLFLGWHQGRRRILVVAAAALYFAMRVWTYLAFVPARLGFAESDHADTSLTAAERHQAYVELKLDDPRWILLLMLFAIYFAAIHPRLRGPQPS
jgi:MFS family permease